MIAGVDNDIVDDGKIKTEWAGMSGGKEIRCGSCVFCDQKRKGLQDNPRHNYVTEVTQM